MRGETLDYLEAVLALVCEHTGLSPKLIRGPSRRRHIVQARHLAISLAAWRGFDNKASQREMAAFFRLDRSSIYHALKAHATRVKRQPAGALALAWEQLKEKVINMLDIGERDQVVEAMRRLHSRRHLRMSTLVAAGHLTALACATESRQLTALLRRLEHQLLGVEMELPAEFNFPEGQLSRLLHNHLLRLRAEGELQEASWIQKAQEVLALDTQTLELPEEGSGPEPAPEAPAPEQEEAAGEEEEDEDDGARLILPPPALSEEPSEPEKGRPR